MRNTLSHIHWLSKRCQQKKEKVTPAKDNTSIRIKLYKIAINRCSLESTKRSSVRIVWEWPSNRTNGVTKPPAFEIRYVFDKWNHNLDYQKIRLVEQIKAFLLVKCIVLIFFLHLIKLKCWHIEGNILCRWMGKKKLKYSKNSFFFFMIFLR